LKDNFQERQFYIRILFGLTAIVLVIKAFDLQVIDDTYRKRADAVSSGSRVLYPSRGEILDRNDKLLVNNDPMYDLLVTYNQLDPEMNVKDFCDLLEIEGEEEYKKLIERDWRNDRFSKRVPFVFMTNLSPKIYTRFQESLYRFPGFYVQQRVVRSYPFSNAAHVLGNIREVNPEEVKDSSEVYRSGDYIGSSGLERRNEYYLRGEKGVRRILKNSMGKEVASYQDGALDVLPEPGMNILTTLDIDLQAYAEELMKNKAGSVVALDPKTGEVLTMVSAPYFDPNVLSIGRNRGAAFETLRQDPNKPFINRATSAQYPPGSLFKSVVALIAMQEGLLNPNRTINCEQGYYFNGQLLTGCHAHPTCTNVSMAIQHSCNAYFVTVYREILDQYGYLTPEKGLRVFNEYLDKFGMGKRLGIDFPGEKKGNYPKVEYFDKVYENEGRWYSIWLRSMGIGQGELLMTNIQMANLAAIIANRGYYYTPHFVNEIKDYKGKVVEKRSFEKKLVGIDENYFEPVVNGMEKAVMGGTAVNAYIWDLPICGKTGTAENNQGSRKDHSIFFAFAPKDDPKIAIAVYIENSGFGGTYAAPIASLIIEKYIKGEISTYRKYLEQRMLDAVLLDPVLQKKKEDTN
jgi:penicillin-binding protein 2